MNIIICTEPSFADSTWCAKILNGIHDKARNRRYNMYTEFENGHNYDVGILIGTNSAWMYNMANKLKKEFKIIFVNCRPNDSSFVNGYVIIDHAKASLQCLSYLKKCGRSKTAIFAVNPYSYTDTSKSVHFAEGDKFYNNGSLSECFESFQKNIAKYDSVVCANYISAVFLIHKLKETGVSVPHDMFICSFGDSILNDKTNPTITTFTTDYYLLGTQAVMICPHVLKTPDNVSTTVTVGCRITAKDSTNNMPFNYADIMSQEFESENRFHSDPAVIEIERVEAAMLHCDEIDKKIIDGLINNKSYINLSMALFMSENTIKYRIKQLTKLTGCRSAKELVNILKKYI